MASLTKEQRLFLSQLLASHSPSGFEGNVSQVWRDHVASSVDQIFNDHLGNTFAVLNPKGSPRILLSGHVDEIGFQVTHIHDKGYLHFAAIGGHDNSMIPGRQVLVHGRNGPIPGVVGKKAIHVMTAEEKNKIPEIHDLWVDIGAGSRKEAMKVVAIGDAVTHVANETELMNECLSSKSLDDRAGAFVVAETLRALSRKEGKLKACIIGVATTQEEIGLRGAGPAAFSADPDMAIILDVSHATDFPGMDARKLGELVLGKGPQILRGPTTHPVIFEVLKTTAEGLKMNFQISPAPSRIGKETWNIQVSGKGVATGTIGIPLRYMHTPCEVASLKDISGSIKLLTTFCSRNNFPGLF